MWKYMLLINKILPKIQKRDFWTWSKDVLFILIPPNSSLPLMESCFQSTKLIILTPSAQSPTSKPPDFHK